MNLSEVGESVSGVRFYVDAWDPSYGAPLVVLGAPLVIAANDFTPSGSDLGSILREICSEIRKTPMAPRAAS